MSADIVKRAEGWWWVSDVAAPDEWLIVEVLTRSIECSRWGVSVPRGPESEGDYLFKRAGCQIFKWVKHLGTSPGLVLTAKPVNLDELTAGSAVPPAPGLVTAVKAL